MSHYVAFNASLGRVQHELKKVIVRYEVRKGGPSLNVPFESD